MHVVVDGRLWENDSFSVINKNLAVSLHHLGYDVRLEAWEQGRDKPHRESFIDRALLDTLSQKPKEYDNAVTIRQSWPRCDPYYSPHYNWDNIQGKIKIGLLPWESEHLPKTWFENMAKVDAIIAISPMSADRIEDELRKHDVKTPVWACPLGVDTRLFHPDKMPWPMPTARGFRFLHVGVGQPRKGSDLLKAAYLEEFTDADDVTLVVKTGGWDSVDAWLAGLPPNAPHILVIYDDNVPETWMGGIYTACDCLVHPARLEGFGMTMLEAMACGIPVIATAAGAHRVFADDSNSILISYVKEQFAFFEDLVGTAFHVNHEDLKQAMRKMLKVNYSDVIQHGLETAEAFSWSNCADGIARLIEDRFQVTLDR